MRSQHSYTPWQDDTPLWLRFLKRNLPLVLFLLFSIIGMSAVFLFFAPAESNTEAVLAASIDGGLSAPIIKAVPAKPVVQRLSQSPGPLRVGIISGHRGFDSGSVCDDGLTEAEVNETISAKVAAALQSQGIHTDTLDEFDTRLDGYSATALVSIHADSCTYINDLATGFKIAGSSLTDSSRLSICLEQAYGESTNLPYHQNTVTPHMTDYHAFREVALGTPSVIIEVGFISLDRAILTETDLPVTGIVDGILCFLENR